MIWLIWVRKSLEDFEYIELEDLLKMKFSKDEIKDSRNKS